MPDKTPSDARLRQYYHVVRNKRSLDYMENFKALLFFFVIVGCNSGDQSSNFMEGKESQVILDFPYINQKVQIQAGVWGIAGGHEEISVSINDNLIHADFSVKLTFYTSEVFYKKIGKDTLQIFAPGSSYKDQVQSAAGHIILDINPLNGYDQVADYNLRYKQLGLSRISVYD